MNHLCILLLLIANTLCAQRDILTFGPNAGQMPTVIFDGDRSEGSMKIYVGKNTKAGNILSINVDNGEKIDSFLFKIHHTPDDAVFVSGKVDRVSKRLIVYSSKPIKEGFAIRLTYRVFTKQKRA